MSAFSEYAARSERMSAVVRFQSALALSVAAAARAPEEDGYPVSGDMLRVLSRGSDTQRRRRRQRARGRK
ncbi:MAG: hypothetical protein ACTH30_05460 [Leucobacter sp.]